MIVLDMENPERCSLCGMMNDEIGEKCSVRGKELDRKELLSKPDWCPIIGELNIEEFSDNADKIGGVIERLVSIGRKIKIGDECHYKDQSDNFIITRIYYEGSRGFFDAISENGSVIYDGTLELIEKTGRNFGEALTNFLQEMEG